ncbi:hypothetical protein [Pedobacter steynii]|uniref:Uncharacterized protein n=1 Tax=Pedobacter steynii TaxID=430522 RepID=A0A1D7QC11_9SPHI|nr:hypothetical protein [Pedobacter steynii]AOM76177.1 hypothetical protein BFS30_02745 [Pedobacter steynii]
MKNLLFIIIGLFTFSNIQAQGIMKDPVSFKLKNGVEIIVAENAGMGKVLASVKIEGAQLDAKSSVASADNGEDFGPKVNYSADEVNVAADIADFEKTFLTMAATLKPAVNAGNSTPSYITIAGDITLAQAKALVKKAFGEWKENTDTELAK